MHLCLYGPAWQPGLCGWYELGLEMRLNELLQWSRVQWLQPWAFVIREAASQDAHLPNLRNMVFYQKSQILTILKLSNQKPTPLKKNIDDTKNANLFILGIQCLTIGLHSTPCKKIFYIYWQQYSVKQSKLLQTKQIYVTSSCHQK